MNLALTVLTMLFAEQQVNYRKVMAAIINGIIRGLLFLIYCLMSPFILYRALKPRRRCPPVRNKLLLLSATELSKRIRSQEVTSEEVVAAYIARCKEVNPIVNAVVEERFETAIQEAKEADDFIRSGKKSIDEIARETPLLGIPVTVKESISVEGMSHVSGTQRLSVKRALKDADAVHRVRAVGGIVLLVSNTPEMCMCWETYNKITGTTFNPYDTRRTAGGSSGGEAALLGSAASLLSLSSDIAGSARLPAMFCGVFGHKPTPSVISTSGHMPDSDDKAWANFFSLCPMVRYAEDLPLLLQAMCQPSKPPLQLDKKVTLNEIKFYYMENDCGSGVTSRIDADIINGLQRLVEHLDTRPGIKVHRANLTGMKYAFEVATTILLHIEGADSIFTRGTDPREWKSVFVEILRYIFLISPYMLSSLIYGILKKTVEKLPESYVKNMKTKNDLLKKQFANLLGNNGVLIYPTFHSAAHFPYEIYYKVPNVSYMMIFNSLGLPVTQCPIGLNSKGLPIGLQIVANPGCDHLTIAVAQEIERVFGGWQQPTPGEKIA